MSNSLSNFLARAIPKAVADAEAAFLRLPEDKRTWSPAATSRTALNQMAEVAMLNGNTAQTIADRAFPADFDMDTYFKDLTALSTDWPKVKAMLDANTAKAVAAIEAVPESDLQVEIQSPFGPLKLEQIMAYPYWNTCYHEGQINYIASILGCLD
jgi:hypothetical protein